MRDSVWDAVKKPSSVATVTAIVPSCGPFIRSTSHRRFADCGLMCPGVKSRATPLSLTSILLQVNCQPDSPSRYTTVFSLSVEVEVRLI